MGFEQYIIDFFAQYAYQPLIVYTGVVLLMLAGSFGFPIPEEVTLVSSGLVAYMAQHPELYPPPTPDAQGVNALTLAIIAFVAVLGADFLVFTLGKFFGKRILETRLFRRFLSPEQFVKINQWFLKYSNWACGIFRFTPGIRFPGFLSCGMMGVPVWKFLLIDGFATLISVPTQVLLVATYGDIIIAGLKEINIGIGVIVGCIILFFIGKQIWLKYKKKKTPQQT